MTVTLYPLMMLALVGLVAGAVVHLLTWFGIAPQSYVWCLHVGVFVVWFPALLAIRKKTGRMRGAVSWDEMLHGCPGWIAYGVKALFGYAALNFLLFMLASVRQGERTSEVLYLRGFSGHWMAFYAVAAVMLYSATRQTAPNSDARCLQGHRMAPDTAICRQCGAPVHRA
jgi:hypothetical protein